LTLGLIVFGFVVSKNWSANWNLVGARQAVEFDSPCYMWWRDTKKYSNYNRCIWIWCE